MRLAILPLLTVLWWGCARLPAPLETPASAQPGAPSTREAPFIAWVETTPEGAGRAVVYYPEEDRQEVLATSPRGGPPPAIGILPSLGFVSSLWSADVSRQSESVYLDSATGRVLHPPSALGLAWNPRRVLLDLVGHRAVVLEHTKLLLCRGRIATLLGHVYVEPAASSRIGIYFGFSPTRRFLVWSGPDGCFRCDLQSGKVQTQEQMGRWLPDRDRLLTQWKAEDGSSHWRVTDAEGREPEATGEGRVGEFSPDGTYWALYNDDPEHDPPRFLQVVPGRQPSAATRIAAGPWAIAGLQARLFQGTRDSARRSRFYRIALGDHREFTAVGETYGGPEVLSLQDGGRLAILACGNPEGAEATAAKAAEVHLMVLDFDGNEKLHTRAARYQASLAGPVGDYVFVVDQSADRYQVKRVNFLTGQVGVVLDCAAESLYVTQVGSAVLAWARHGGGTADAHRELFVGRHEGQEWQRLSEYARTVQWGPSARGLLY